MACSLPSHRQALLVRQVQTLIPIHHQSSEVNMAKQFKATHEIVDSDGMWVDDVMAYRNGDAECYVTQVVWEEGGRHTTHTDLRRMGWSVQPKTSHSTA